MRYIVKKKTKRNWTTRQTTFIEKSWSVNDTSQCFTTLHWISCINLIIGWLRYTSHVGIPQMVDDHCILEPPPAIEFLKRWALCREQNVLHKIVMFIHLFFHIDYIMIIWKYFLIKWINWIKLIQLIQRFLNCHCSTAFIVHPENVCIVLNT